MAVGLERSQWNDWYNGAFDFKKFYLYLSSGSRLLLNESCNAHNAFSMMEDQLQTYHENIA